MKGDIERPTFSSRRGNKDGKKKDIRTDSGSGGCCCPGRQGGPFRRKQSLRCPSLTCVSHREIHKIYTNFSRTGVVLNLQPRKKRKACYRGSQEKVGRKNLMGSPFWQKRSLLHRRKRDLTRWKITVPSSIGGGRFALSMTGCHLASTCGEVGESPQVPDGL